MRKFYLILVFVFQCALLMAQKNENFKSGFDKTKLFTGGDITGSFFNGVTVLGANPHFGYALTDWLSVAVKANYIYSSQRFEDGEKYRQSITSPGVFLRAFPLPFLFFQVQPEHNFMSNNFINSLGVASKSKEEVNSLLVGAGICQGRLAGDNNYFYFNVLFDVLNLPTSPYLNKRTSRPLPIVSAGLNIALFGGR